MVVAVGCDDHNNMLVVLLAARFTVDVVFVKITLSTVSCFKEHFD